MKENKNDIVNNIATKLNNYNDDTATSVLEYFYNNTLTFNINQWKELWCLLVQSENESMKFVFLWECLMHDMQNDKLEYYTQLLCQSEKLTWDQKYYLGWQIDTLLFNYCNLGTDKITESLYKNYHAALHSFMSHLNNLTFIKDRNEELVFVTTQQFLNLTHGPTKTTLDRALVLKRKLGKNVVIINTAELMGTKSVNLITSVYPNYYDEYLNIDMYEYCGEQFLFVQFDNNMPNIYNSQEFIEFVRKNRSYYIVNIGVESLLIDACSKIVPVVDITLGPSDISKTEATALVIGRDIKPSDNKFLNMVGKSTDYIIKGRFTSSLKSQEHSYTREKFNIPENCFVMTVVGGRLANEMDNKFIDMIDECLLQGAYLCIMGNMDNYEVICQKDDVFRNHSTYLGMQNDVLAILDLCDLYVNPKRKGGGTSVIEAMYKSIPAISINYGDVALGAGGVFCVDTYEEMKQCIMKYMTDREFYDDMSMKAKARADYMLDSDSAFVDIINEFCDRFVCNYAN